ncbi:lipopolysaccharide biosynthesis protein [Portibacter lacus]|uniref:Lipopolysaccharide biosynthesis protein n=1 Tax=Portibacter lacus TaxID=1099794 RepID=A0AA37WFQ4_9BACT|nr:lipopolysaccharide biosynthesis protein [Portibacter lacus]GLR19018.1 lipopolysaccharide biosynthesis protein [Portibacter lacus]
MNKYKYSIIAQIGLRIFTFIVSIILINLIAPANFGLIAMLAPLLAFQNLFHSFGTVNSIISKESINDNEVNSLVWSKLIFSVIINIIFVLSASYIVDFYGQPELKWIIKYYAFSSVFFAITQIFTGILYKKEDFKKVASIEVISVVSSSLIAIGLAYFQFDLLALVIRDFCLILFTFILSVFFVQWKPSFRFKLSDLTYYFTFGSHITLNAIVNFFGRNLDDILIGKKYGSTDLGVYSKSYALLTMPHAIITNIAVKLAMPVVSRQKSNLEALDIYKKIVWVVFNLNTPLSLIIFFTADYLIPKVFGIQWVMMIPYLKLFCLLSIFQAIGPIDNLIFQGRRKTKLFLYFGLILNVTLVLSLVLGYYLTNTAYGIAIYYVTASILTFLPSQYFTANAAETTMINLLKNIAISIFACGICFLMIFTVSNFLVLQNAIGTILLIIGIPLIYFLLVYAMNSEKVIGNISYFSQIIRKENG